MMRFQYISQKPGCNISALYNKALELNPSQFGTAKSTIYGAAYQKLCAIANKDMLKRIYHPFMRCYFPKATIFRKQFGEPFYVLYADVFISKKQVRGTQP